VITILIVDDDLGFVFWLGQALDRAGFETWPARSVAAAESLLLEIKLLVDLLVIPCSLPSAPVLVSHLGSTGTDFRVIAVCDELCEQVEQFPRLSAVHQRPQTMDTTAQLEWVQLVKGVLVDKQVSQQTNRTSPPPESGGPS
jgi:DNA-binding response OmpR family regulator